MSFMASGCVKLPIRCLEKWKAGYQPLHVSVHLQTSEFERVSKNVSHKRLCQIQLAINKFNADKNLVKLNFSYRECLLGL